MDKIYEAYKQTIINEKKIQLYTWPQIKSKLGINKSDFDIPDDAYPQDELGISKLEVKAIIKYLKVTNKKHTIKIDDTHMDNVVFTLNSLEDHRIFVSATI